MAVIQQIKSWLRSLATHVYKEIEEDASGDEGLELLEGGRDVTIGRVAAGQDPSRYCHIATAEMAYARDEECGQTPIQNQYIES
ncbi:hypothetical protein UA08_04334 [Talaromyces atroroseus]|uniref:Uncharacterized protein n=1 Tax=Talaromyces atroroseus TaxID=1441469 RepID=A0A1Q5Q8N8_TALAT|nr:hypothetical protein UA08_04334 [Talaromyces atroroseus]OKL60496.1 hypothetical protein UA08_04334 [Talaromyces atroroseus]